MRVSVYSVCLVLTLTACVPTAAPVALPPGSYAGNPSRIGAAFLPSEAAAGDDLGVEAPFRSGGEEARAGDSLPPSVEGASVGGPSAAPTSAALTAGLASWPGAFVRDPEGELAAVFGFAPAEAREILLPVTRDRGLPMDYWPGDLLHVSGGRSGVLVRAVVLADLQELAAAAQLAGFRLGVASGFRSFATQGALFEGRVSQRLADAGWTINEDEARQRANGGTALPGHSQHQLGTALDFSTPELGYQVTRAFVHTGAGQWLREHAWEYGFVFPYTEAGRARTGFIAEPWHLRWVGRPLAAFLQADEYLESVDVVVDDYLEAIASSLNE